MSKHKKDQGFPKTLVEKYLDKQKVSYEQFSFPTAEVGDVAQLQVDHLNLDEHDIYKTLVLTGNKTGPLVGVVPLDTHIDYRKLSAVSGNKKVGMVPLKDLVATTGYEHGANTPIGIYEKYHYPIYIDTIAESQGTILVSAGKIGRSVKIDVHDLQKIVAATFADITDSGGMH